MGFLIDPVSLLSAACRGCEDGPFGPPGGFLEQKFFPQSYVMAEGEEEDGDDYQRNRCEDNTGCEDNPERLATQRAV